MLADPFSGAGTTYRELTNADLRVAEERRSTPAPEAIASIESAVRLLTHCSKSIRDGRPLPVELRQLDRTAMQLLGK